MNFWPFISKRSHIKSLMLEIQRSQKVADALIRDNQTLVKEVSLWRKRAEDLKAGSCNGRWISIEKAILTTRGSCKVIMNNGMELEGVTNVRVKADSGDLTRVTFDVIMSKGRWEDPL